MSKNAFALYEPGLARPELLEAGVYKKDVIRTGVWHVGKKRLQVTPERMDHWVSQFDAMAAAGIRIPAPVDHSGASEDNKGWIKNVWRDGDTLYCSIEVPREQDDAKIGSTIREVSIAVDSEFRDGTGKVWQDVISHIAPCTEPVVSGQQNFVRVAARNADGRQNQIDIVLSRKETSMDVLLQAVRKALGADEKVSEEDLAKQLEEKWAGKNTTLKRAKDERDNAFEASRKDSERVEALEAKVQELEKGNKPPQETEREIQLRQRVEAMEDRAAMAEVEAAVASGKLIDKVKADAALLLRSDSLELSRKGEDAITAQAAFRKVLDSLPVGASLDLEERAKRSVELRNPNAGEEATEQEKEGAGRAAARRVQGRKKDQDDKD